MNLQIQIDEGSQFTLKPVDNKLIINGKEQHYSLQKINNIFSLLSVNNKNYKVTLLEDENNSLSLLINGQPIKVHIKDHIAQILEQLGMDASHKEKINELVAPMPGAILEILVSEGQEVKQGDSLLILEAMKMENIIKSPTDGTIHKLLVEKGNNVEKNQVLISF